MRFPTIVALVSMILTNAAVSSAEQSPETRTLSYSSDSAALEAAGRLTGLKYYGPDKGIGLHDRVLIEDDAPGNGPPEGFDRKEMAWYEKLSKGIAIRKEFMLDAPEAFKACLAINGVEHEHNTHSLFIDVNGTTIERPATQYAHPRAEHLYIINENNYFTDNWFIIEIPAGALRAGSNSITLRTESEEPSWEVVVAAANEFRRGSETRTEHPNRSAKSRDGGKTWDDTRLGWKDALDGEYAIRLSLDRFVSRGVYESAVYDLAAQPDNHSIKRAVDILDTKLTWNIDTPEGTTASISIRYGDTPVPSADGWTEYRPVSGNRTEQQSPTERYYQFKVDFTTDNPLKTPTLSGLDVTTRIREQSSPDGPFIRITDIDNSVVTRSAFPFRHEDYKALADFRKRFKLDELTANCTTEFEKQLKILRFAYEIPIDSFNPYNWDYNNVPVLKTDENGNILRQTDYTGRRRDKHCLFSNFTLMGACISMGWPARFVNLQTEGRMHAHEVMEVWSNDYDKWIFMDATRDYYLYDPETGVPLSLTEINARLAEIVPSPPDWDNPIWKQMPDYADYLAANVGYREGNNAFSIKDINHGPHLLMLKGQLHQVIRSDFATHPGLVPWRVSGHWAGNQFMGWYTDTFARKREYGMNTNREQDFNPPLNRSALTLSETGHQGVLRVDIDTVTPFFSAFVITVDNGDTFEIGDSSFEWPLHEGLNHLTVRAKNNVGVTGKKSTVTVVMNN